MYNETKIVEGEERFLHVSIEGQDYLSARVTQAIVYDNLTKRKIIGWLNGHKIFDTGEVDKIKKLEYEFDDLSLIGLFIEKGDKLRFWHQHRQFEGNVVGLGQKKTYFVECGTYTYAVKQKDIISVNNKLIRNEGKLLL